MEVIKILQGNCLEVLKDLPDQSVNTCITSPPYWGLRNYQEEEQLGLEDTPEEYVENLVKVFREVKRVLRDDGTVWLNLGDSFSKEKQLQGTPWRVAFALQSDGWYLRQDIIWHKPNPMPESVRDRCTKAHEYIFLLGKNAKYYFDNEAIKEKGVMTSSGSKQRDTRETHGIGGGNAGLNLAKQRMKKELIEKGFVKRNKRSVWTVTTKPFKGAHFATFPPDLIKPCVLAGCPEGGTVLDPFGGAGTTGLVAQQHNRNCILIELNPEYAQIARDRLYNDAPLFADVESEVWKSSTKSSENEE